MHLIKIRRGKANFKDKMFWIEIGVTVGIIFIFLSGMFWDILAQIYDWTSSQDITETTKK
ncbi:hypothetical protein D3C85_1904730 [compost metagenome]